MAKQGAAQRSHKAERTRPAPVGFWREDLADYLNRTPSGIDKLRSRGELPPPFTIGRAPFWLKTTIDDWLAAKAGA